MRPAYLRYHLRSILPLCVLVPALLLPLWLPATTPDTIRVATYLLPLIPLIWIYLLYLRYLRDSDELERRIEVEALGFSAAATMLVALGGLLLSRESGVAVETGVALIAVLLGQTGSYSLARLWLRSRYQ